MEEVETAPDERAIAFAVFQLLGERSGAPLLIAVDDVQWLDAASASVLALSLRRLGRRSSLRRSRSRTRRRATPPFTASVPPATAARSRCG
jgi:predicted ATPase